LVKEFSFVDYKTEYMSRLEKTLDHEFHGIVLGSTMDLKHINTYNFFRGISSLRLMDEKIGFVPMSFAFSKGHYFIQSYNEVIGRLRDAGITEYWIHRDYRKNEKIDDFGPQVLDMFHLEVCFYVCMFPLVFAFLAFFGEISAELFKYICKKLRQKLRDGISTCRLRFLSQNRIIQVRPIGFEREQTKCEKISAAFKSVKSKIQKKRVKIPKPPTPVKFKLSPQKRSPQRSQKLESEVKSFYSEANEKLSSKIASNKKIVKTFLDEKFPVLATCTVQSFLKKQN
jgi:hypothetical protein